MSALSIRERIEYIILGVAVIIATSFLAYHMVQTEGDTAGFAALIVGLLGIAVGRQLIFLPPETSLADLLASLRAPKQSTQTLAEVINDDNEVVGHTTYSER